MAYLLPIFELRCALCQTISAYKNEFKGDEKTGVRLITYACENDECKEFGVEKLLKIPMEVTPE
jgi:hypothetical protein